MRAQRSRGCISGVRHHTFPNDAIAHAYEADAALSRIRRSQANELEPIHPRSGSELEMEVALTPEEGAVGDGIVPHPLVIRTAAADTDTVAGSEPVIVDVLEGTAAHAIAGAVGGRPRALIVRRVDQGPFN